MNIVRYWQTREKHYSTVQFSCNLVRKQVTQASLNIEQITKLGEGEVLLFHKTNRNVFLKRFHFSILAPYISFQQFQQFLRISIQARINVRIVQSLTACNKRNSVTFLEHLNDGGMTKKREEH